MIGYGKPPKKFQFPKGVSGNPAGPGKRTIASKVLKQYTQRSVAEAFNRLLELPRADLSKIVEDQSAPIIEVVLATALLRDIRRAKINSVERILDRVIGKPSQAILIKEVLAVSPSLEHI